MSVLPRAVPVDGPPTEADLESSETFDYDDPAVRAWVDDLIAGAHDDAERARRLFAAVRDEVRYDPYGMIGGREAFRASATLASGGNWCVPKAILLVAAARAAGIPARLGFADVRNHLSSEKLLERMGTDMFVYHGYASLFLGGDWRKTSPAFNRELCARFGVAPLEFDGRSDALLHAYDGEGRRHMEYVNDRGTWSDLPLEDLQQAFADTYGEGSMMAPRDAADPAFDR